MTVESYLSSREFLRFQDEDLRHHACGLADRFLEGNDPVDKSQLHAIPTAIQAGGYPELKRLVEKQRSKNTKTKNKAFWGFLFSHVVNLPGEAESLPARVREELAGKGLLQDEDAVAEKKERNRIKKENKGAMEAVLNGLLGVYFEHFNCHYFYRLAGRRQPSAPETRRP